MSEAAVICFAGQIEADAADAWIASLQQALPAETILRLDQMSPTQRAACRIAIVANPDPAQLAQLPQLQWVHSVWAGVERLVPLLQGTEVALTRLVDPQLGATMAEAVLAWTLYLHRDMPLYAQRQRFRIWQQAEYVLPERRTVGILGLGALGEHAAQALLGARFKVAGWSRSQRELAGVQCFAGDEGLRDLLGISDILVCLLPLTPETRGLLDAERLAMLPPNAQLINFARGPIIDDQALCDALDQRQLRHAVLDVFDVEPLPADRWQWTHPDVTVLPHISAPTDRDSAVAIVAANVRRYRDSGQIPANVDLQRGY